MDGSPAVPDNEAYEDRDTGRRVRDVAEAILYTYANCGAECPIFEHDIDFPGSDGALLVHDTCLPLPPITAAVWGLRRSCPGN